MMRRASVLLAIVLLLLLAGCGNNSVQIFNDIKGEPYANSNLYTAGNFTYSAADIDAIELCWRVGEIELVESDNDTLSVTESGDELDLDTQMYHYLDGRILRIQFCRSGSSIHVKSADKALTVTIPKGIDLSIYNTAADIHAETLEQKSVFISSHSGNLDCGTLAAGAVDLSSSSGNIQVEHLTGDSLELETTSGKVELGEADVTGDLSCVSVSGNLTFDSLKAASLAIDTTSANVDIGKLDCPCTNINSTSGKLKLALPENGAKLNFVTVSGDLKTALPYETVGDLRVFGDGGSEIGAVTISGDLELR